MIKVLIKVSNRQVEHELGFQAWQDPGSAVILPSLKVNNWAEYELL